MRGRGKKTAGPQALGRSRGGFSTKIHAACDSHGNPLRFILTPGQASDHTQAHALLEDFEVEEAVLADKGYDSDALVKTITETGADCVIPPTRNRTMQREYDTHLYKERNQVERLFNKLKNFRRVATRYDKLDIAFMSFIHLAAIYLWLK
jgi:putative transposase